MQTRLLKRASKRGMTKVSEEDLAFDTLRAVRAEVAPDLDAQLVEKCYAIQKAHQFNADRSISAQLMDRLIDEYVDTIMETGAGGSSE